MDSPKLVFKYKFERLRELLKGGEQAQLLDVAAILRHLLLEGQALMDIVNREFHLPIRFRVFRSASESAEKFPVKGIKPTFVFAGTVWPPFAPMKDLKKEKFLDFDIIYLSGIKFTVKNIIELCANQLGGVHYDELSRDQNDSVLRELNKTLEIGGASVALSSLLLIGNITIGALTQLYEKVNEQKESGIVP